jgi:hypothetical protein
MAKVLKIGEIVNIEGRPLRTPKRDQDGDIIWKTRCPVCDHPEDNTAPELESLDTIKAIRSLIFQMPNELRKPDDSQNSFYLLSQIREQDGNDTLTLQDAEYEFLHRVINREIPSDSDDQETFGTALWGINSWVIIQQLTPEGVEILASS